MLGYVATLDMERPAPACGDIEAPPTPADTPNPVMDDDIPMLIGDRPELEYIDIPKLAGVRPGMEDIPAL